MQSLQEIPTCMRWPIYTEVGQCCVSLALAISSLVARRLFALAECMKVCHPPPRLKFVYAILMVGGLEPPKRTRSRFASRHGDPAVVSGRIILRAGRYATTLDPFSPSFLTFPSLLPSLTAGGVRTIVK